MRQRGRISASNLALVRSEPATSRVHPPANATDTEAKLFNEVVASCHPDHFLPGDEELILSYVQATLAVRRFANDKSTVRAWETANKVQIITARTLRLTPRSRTTSKVAARKGKAHRPSFYDLMDSNDANNARDN